MKKFITILFSAAAALASANHASAEGTDVVCGPWLQNVTDDSFTVMWITEGKCLSWIETAPDDGTAFEVESRPRTYQTIAGKRYIGTLHSVRVDGLDPGTSYRYRILAKELLDDSCFYCYIYGKELTTAASGTVRTLDYGAESCRFSMVNDIHDNPVLYRALTDPARDSGLDFLLLNGDIVNSAADIDTVAAHTFGYIADMTKDVPVFFARGNHEGRGSDSYLVSNLFSTPTGEFYYIFRQGPVGFIVLDAGEDKPDSVVEYSGLADYDSYRAAELEWMKEAVKDPLFADAPVKVAICHIPSFALADSWYSQVWANKNFNPILNDAGVDLMLSGHHHEHIFVDAGECGNDFPVIANDDEARLDFSATASAIEIRIYDRSNTLQHSFSFPID